MRYIAHLGTIAAAIALCGMAAGTAAAQQTGHRYARNAGNDTAALRAQARR